MPIDDHHQNAETMRALIARKRAEPSLFRDALLRVPPSERDAWVDSVFELDDLPGDAPQLPSGCVPYLPCSVDTLLRVVEQAPVGPSDVFVDVGSGLGRAGALVQLLTGAPVIGLEIQTELVRAARDLMARLQLSQVSWLEGDAAKLTSALEAGSVFFLYCPFSGGRLAKVLAALERVARTKAIRVCTVDLPLPPCPWLEQRETTPSGELAIYQSCSPPPDHT